MSSSTSSEGVRGAEQRLAAIAMDRGLATSTISVFEVVRGADSEDVVRRFFNLIADFELAAFTRPAALEAAEAWRAVRRAGTPVDTGDLLIAGIALANGMTLVTRNQRDFRRVPRLDLIDF